MAASAADFGDGLRCRYGEEMSAGTSVATDRASNTRQRTTELMGHCGVVEGDVTADYDDDDNDHDRERHGTQGTHRKHKAQKQVASPHVP